MIRDYATVVTAALALMLPGCAAQALRGAQNDCSAFGRVEGSDAYAACVQERFGQRQSAIQAGFANMGRTLQSPGYTAPAPATNDGVGVAFLRNNYVSGTSRVCEYNRMGNAYVMTISAMASCPLSVD